MAGNALPPLVVSRGPVTLPVLYGSRGERLTVVTPEGGYPFPAGDPLPQRLPVGTPPRRFVPSPYQNLSITPRRQGNIQLTPFETLRALANNDIARIALEALKGTLKGLAYEVVLRPEFEKDQGRSSSVGNAQVNAARRWMDVPNPLAREEWDDWIGKVFEETLVTDALSIVPRHTRGGEFIGLEVVDGGTILPLVDDRGCPPTFPSPAFQQITYGYPETDFFTRRTAVGVDDELWYWPRNRRATSLYGQSEIERVILSFNIIIRHMMNELTYFTAGAIPDALYAVTETWTSEAIQDFQQTFDDMLAGRDDRRAGAVRFVPDGKYYATKTREWKYEYLEFFVRLVAWNLSVSPLPIMKAIGRNPADSLDSGATKAGTKPLGKFLCRLMTRTFRDELGLPFVMLQIAEDDTEDPAVIAARNVSYVKSGLRTFNSIRGDIGEEPYDGAWADRPMLVGTDGTTVTFLDEIEQKMADQEKAAEEMRAKLAGGGADGEANGTDNAGDGKTVDDNGPKPPAPAAPTPAAKALREYAFARRKELADCRAVALKLARAGKPMRKFEFRYHTPKEAAQIMELLGVMA